MRARSKQQIHSIGFIATLRMKDEEIRWIFEIEMSRIRYLMDFKLGVVYF